MRSAPQAPQAKTPMSLSAFRDGMHKRSVKDQVGNKLEALIASGILQVGDALPSERDLATALAVSRETVRSAIRELAARGIVAIAHGARTRVVKPDVGAVTIGFAIARALDSYDIDAVHATRLLVEREVVAAAARAVDADTLKSLARMLKAQQAATDDPVRFLISDREFHVTIYRASGNLLLADFATDIYGYVIERRRMIVSRPGAITASYQDHLAIFDALKHRDVGAAVRAFEVHADRIYTTTRSVMEVAEG